VGRGVLGVERLSHCACNIFYFVLMCSHNSNVATVEADGQPSFTAMTAAAARAAHLIVDGEPTIFADTAAGAMLGERAEEFISYHRVHGTHPVLAGARAQVTCRSRYTEDCLARAVRDGIGQYVILGAGLDTFAYRSPLARRVRVFEVDHPATQEWKRRARPAPGTITFVPVDLLGDSLEDGLRRAGFDFDAPAFVSWLGVTMYLDDGAIERTAAVLGGLASGTELVADYMLPAGLRDAAGDTYAELVGQASAERGEPWRSVFAPDAMAALLARHGFGPARDVSQREMIQAGLWERSDSLRPVELSHIAHAVSLPDGR
jgi:methyltransferase (TIGR00027 family)